MTNADGLPPTPDSENKLLRTWMGQDLSPMPTPGSTQMNGMWSPKLQSYVSPQVGGRTMNAPTPGSSYLTGGNAATQAGFANSTPATNETHAKPYATKREQQRMRQREMEARARELEAKNKGKAVNHTSASLSSEHVATSKLKQKNAALIASSNLNNSSTYNNTSTPIRHKRGKVP